MISKLLEFRQNDQPAETILNAIKILLPGIKQNQRRQMSIAQKVDALDAMGNILIGVFENTDENYVFDETSRLGKISIRCSLQEGNCFIRKSLWMKPLSRG